MDQLNIIAPKHFLIQELKRRTEVNPKYSLRAFARTLGLTPSGLSLVLAGKRNLSLKTAEKVADILSLNPNTKNAFLNGCRTGQSLNFVEENQSFNELPLDRYEVIADWYHYAILSLICTKGFKPSIVWISKRLGISSFHAKDAVDRLKRLKILDTSGKKWKQIGNPLSVENIVSTSATRKFHKQVLEKAIQSLENDPMAFRDLTCMTMAFDPKYLPLAIPQITKFRRHMMAFLESLGKPSEVYNLSVQLYPISRVDHD